MDRPHYLSQIHRLLKSHPIVAILGPRQCGKTTLARMFAERCQELPQSNTFDMENPVDLKRLENPILTLKPLTGLIIIDEIQRRPDLFPILRVLADDPSLDQHYLILGSACSGQSRKSFKNLTHLSAPFSSPKISPCRSDNVVDFRREELGKNLGVNLYEGLSRLTTRDLIQQSSESLAGRIAYLELTPFSYDEVDHIDTLWLRGGFPRSYLAKSNQESEDWRASYIRTFLEQDIPNLGIKIPPTALRRFWIMLSHYHGNLFNASELGRSFGASDTTMRKYLDLLTGTFMVRQLQPWHQNIRKRQVKSPKIYFRDSGILHSIIGVDSKDSLHMHPKVGASWEGFALEEVIRKNQAYPEECFFWSTYSEAEVDLLIHQKGKLTAFEFKYVDAPKITKSITIALQDLPIDHLYIIYPGDTSYPLSKKVTASPLKDILIALRSV